MVAADRHFRRPIPHAGLTIVGSRPKCHIADPTCSHRWAHLDRWPECAVIPLDAELMPRFLALAGEVAGAPAALGRCLIRPASASPPREASTICTGSPSSAASAIFGPPDADDIDAAVEVAPGGISSSCPRGWSQRRPDRRRAPRIDERNRAQRNRRFCRWKTRSARRPAGRRAASPSPAARRGQRISFCKTRGSGGLSTHVRRGKGQRCPLSAGACRESPGHRRGGGAARGRGLPAGPGA